MLDLTSPDRLYRAWRHELRDAARTARRPRVGHPLATLLPPHERQLPIVTVHDAASHALAWLGSVFGARVVPVGVDDFGQSGSIVDLYRNFDLLPDQLVNAALVASGVTETHRSGGAPQLGLTMNSVGSTMSSTGASVGPRSAH